MTPPALQSTDRNERKAAMILIGIATTEGTWVAANLWAGTARFLAYTGFSPGGAPLLGWVLALMTAAMFTAFAARLPSVRANLLTPSLLKLLGLAVAVSAGFCEEAIFRKLLMDGMQHAGYAALLQVLASGLAFGLVHGVWGFFRGSLAAGIGATLATGALGAALAVVYLMSDRVLAPCVVAHVVINALAEPGLVLAAVRGEMSRDRGQAQ